MTTPTQRKSSVWAKAGKLLIYAWPLVLIVIVALVVIISSLLSK